MRAVVRVVLSSSAGVSFDFGRLRVAFAVYGQLHSVFARCKHFWPAPLARSCLARSCLAARGTRGRSFAAGRRRAGIMRRWGRCSAKASSTALGRNIQYRTVHAGRCRRRQRRLFPNRLNVDGFCINRLHRRIAGNARTHCASAIDELKLQR